MEISDTRRRARIRGRESVARWRLNTGMWAGRVIAGLNVGGMALAMALGAVPSLGRLLVGLTIGVVTWIVAERVGRGDRWAATLLFVVFALGTVLRVVNGQHPITEGFLFNAAAVFCLSQGVWGAFALAAVRRDAAQVPLAPELPEGRAPRRPMFREER